jgi:hypothetical protein
VSLTLIFNPAQKREGFFHGLAAILAEKPVNPQKYLKLYNKYDSYPVDVEKMLPLPGIVRARPGLSIVRTDPIHVLNGVSSEWR